MRVLVPLTAPNRIPNPMLYMQKKMPRRQAQPSYTEPRGAHACTGWRPAPHLKSASAIREP